MSYKVQGNVIIPDVLVSAGGGLEDTSDAQGNFAILNVPAGEHTFTPTKVGSIFDPVDQTIDVQSDILPFDASVQDGTVLASALQVDGKILIGGSFTEVNGEERIRIARLNPDGSLDDSFTASCTSNVRDIAIQPGDGKILIVGDFLEVNGQVRNRIARLEADGSLDESFTTTCNDTVRAITFQSDGKILIGGYFSSVNAVSKGRIARLETNGTLDTTFTTSVTGGTARYLRAILVQSDDKILIGGYFNSIDGVSKFNITRLNSDGSLDGSFVASCGDSLHSMALQSNNKILIGGTFTTVNGVTRLRIARLEVDGTLDVGFTASCNSTVFTIAVQSNKRIIISGSFTEVNSTPKSFFARLNETGTLNHSFIPSNIVVRTIIEQPDNKIVISGGFGEVNGEERLRVARLHPDGELDKGVTFNHTYVTHTLTYTAGANGSILGETPQTVDYGFDGTEVTAIADPGYKFVQWSDTSTQNPRQDTNVTSDISVTATFQALETEHTVEGSVGVAGALVSSDGVITTSNARGIYSLVLDSGEQTITPTKVGSIFDPVDQTIDIQRAYRIFRFRYDDGGALLAKQTDGKIFMAGVFSIDGGPKARHFIRLNSDYTIDSTFTAGTPSRKIWGVHLQSDGKLLVVIRGVDIESTLLYRLEANGDIDPTFAAVTFEGGLLDHIKWVTQQTDGQCIVVGSFLTVNGVARSRIARISTTGTLDTTYTPEVNGEIWAAAVDADGRTVIGGEFTTVSGSARSNIALLNENGSVRGAFNPGANSMVRDLKVQANGQIMACGDFTVIDGQNRSKVARLQATGVLDATFNAVVSTSVFSVHLLSAGGYALYGYLGSVNGVPRPQCAKVSNTGALDEDFDLSVSYDLAGTPIVRQAFLEVENDENLVVISFGPELNATTVKVRASSGIEAEGISFAHAYETHTLTYTAGANGSILGETPQTVDYGFDGTAVTAFPNEDYQFVEWSDGSTDNPRQDTNVTDDISVEATFALISDPAIVHGTVVVPGALIYDDQGAVVESNSVGDYSIQVEKGFRTFTPQKTGSIFTPTTRDRDVQFDITNFAAKVQGPVSAISRQGNGQIVFGGGFTLVNGTIRQWLARVNVDGSFDSSFTPTFNNNVLAVAVQPNDQKILVGGDFTSVNGQDRFNIVRLNPNGTTDQSFNASTIAAVWAIVVQSDGKILIGGDFTSVNGVERRRIARLNEDGSIDLSFSTLNSFNGPVRDILILSTGKILVGGGFTYAHGGTYNRIARLEADGVIDPSFNPNCNDVVLSLAEKDDGKLLIGGGFTTVKGTTRNRIAQLNSTGTLDTDFTTSSNGGIWGLVIQPDQQILIAGSFKEINGISKSGVARLNPNGTVDQTFIASVAPRPTQSYPYVYALLQQPDEKVLIGGLIGQVNNEDVGSMTRLNNDGSLEIGVNFAHTYVQYTLKYIAGANGSITGQKNQTVNHGFNGTQVTAVPNTGYRFVQWSDGSTINPRQDLNVTGDIEVTAIFAIKTYTFEYFAGEGGQVMGETFQMLDHGQVGTPVEAVPDEGEEFLGWSDGVTTATRTDVATQDISVTAFFGKIFMVSYFADPGGSISGEAFQLVSQGGDAEPVTAVPGQYSSFKRWSDGKTEPLRQDTNVQADMTFTAEFIVGGAVKFNSNVPSHYWINNIKYTTGEIHIIPPGTYIVTFQPLEGYATPEPKQIVITADTLQECDVYYDPESVSYTITGNVGAPDVEIGGVLSDINGDYTVTVFHGATLSLEPKLPGYYFCPKVRTFTDVRTNFTDQDHIISNGLEPPSVTLTLNVEGFGSVVGGGEYPVGSFATAYAQPHVGWEFVEWSDGNTDAVREIEMVNNITLTAKFQREVYTITTSTTGGGSVSPPTQEHEYGDDATVIAVANPDYSFTGWFYGEARQSTLRTFTFKVTKDANLEGRFVLTSSLPLDEKETVGVMTEQLGVDKDATFGDSISLGVTRVNDTEDIQNDVEYLTWRESEGSLAISKQKGPIHAPTEKQDCIRFEDRIKIPRLGGQSLTYEEGEFEYLSVNAKADLWKVESKEIRSQAVDTDDLIVRGNALFLQGYDNHVDTLSATGYINVGQGNQFRLRAGGIRYTGAVRATIIEAFGTSVTFDQNYVGIVGKIIIMRGGYEEYTIVSGSNATYELDKPGKLGECIIYTTGDWEGWDGGQWVSFSQSGVGEGGISRLDQIQDPEEHTTLNMSTYAFNLRGGSTTTTPFSIGVTGETNPRLSIRSDGRIIATAGDTASANLILTPYLMSTSARSTVLSAGLMTLSNPVTGTAEIRAVKAGAILLSRYESIHEGISHVENQLAAARGILAGRLNLNQGDYLYTFKARAIDTPGDNNTFTYADCFTLRIEATDDHSVGNTPVKGVYTLNGDDVFSLEEDTVISWKDFETHGNYYLGNKETDGSWRFHIDGTGELLVQRLESSIWVTHATLGS